MSQTTFTPVGPDPIDDADRLMIQRLYDERAVEYQAAIDANLEPKRRAARKLAEASGLTDAEIEALFGVSL